MRRSRIAAAAASLSIILASSASARADEASAQETTMRSPPALGVGIFLSSVGSAGLAAGGYLFATGAGACDQLPTDQVPTERQVDACTAGVNRQVGGVVGLVTGGAFLLGGIPLLAVGASPVTREASTKKPRVALDVGPLSLGVRGEF
jgi:hypothetical protein